MALSPTDIEINCKHGLDIASELSRAADEFQSQLNTYEGISSDLQASWTGANASRFAGTMSDIAMKIEAQVNSLRDLSSAIERTVEVYRDQQMTLYREEQAAKKAKSSKGSSGGGHSAGGGGHKFA